LVTIVAEKLDELHSTFGDRLKVAIKIPCNCPVCKASNTPHFYDKKDLENRLAKGKPTVECRESFDDVNVQGLLDGIFNKSDQTPISLLQAGSIREALLLLMPNDEAALLLNQLDKAEKEYDFGRANPEEFAKIQNRISVAAMKMMRKR
ncbi:MAG: hypothetical protein H7246_16280, partial [Phycisphaerae bacterium]|nr:hypothetical protein [Saprospiraceae bacterium]